MIIQCVSHGLVVKNSQILVYKVVDKVSNKSFYRSIGGHVEFGEDSAQTLRREFKEEINRDILITKKLGIYENIFSYKGEKSHEYVSLYMVEFEDQSVYDMKEIVGNEGPFRQFIASWIPINKFLNNEEIIFPEQTLIHLKNV